MRINPWAFFVLAAAATFAVLMAPGMQSHSDEGQAIRETVPIQAGPFTMGVDPAKLAGWATSFGWQADWFQDETPAHKVDLPAFAMDRAEVTNTSYALFLKSSGRRAPAFWAESSFPSGQESFPVTGVTWADAGAYCTWAGGHLPTEAEWEKAARGADHRLWPWGNEWEKGRANTAETAGPNGAALPVAQFAAGASPYGVLDMAGNVWEWTSDWYAPYAAGDVTAQQVYKVARGGSWRYARDLARATTRLGLPPDDRQVDVGFRCVYWP